MNKHNDGCTCCPDEFVKHLPQCACDHCSGGCCETSPTCGECFLCEANADDWWEGSEEQGRSSEAWDDHLQKLNKRGKYERTINTGE